MFFLQFVVGATLIFVGWALWYAKRNVDWKKWIEKTFLDEGEDLFASGHSYSGYVKWGRYVSFFAGLAMLIPTIMLYDIIIGTIAAGCFWWMSTKKAQHDDVVRTTTQNSET